MALADILKRIDRDAEAEVAALVNAAEVEAERFREAAVAHGADYHEQEIARAEREAAEEARTRIATARLTGRDRVANSVGGHSSFVSQFPVVSSTASDFTFSGLRIASILRASWSRASLADARFSGLSAWAYCRRMLNRSP